MSVPWWESPCDVCGKRAVRGFCSRRVVLFVCDDHTVWRPVVDGAATVAKFAEFA